MAMPGAVTMESRADWEAEVAGQLGLDPQRPSLPGLARTYVDAA